MLKLIGALITVLCALAYSVSKNSAADLRIKKCKQLCRFLCECRHSLERHARPIEDIVNELPLEAYADFAEAVRRAGLEAAVSRFKDDLVSGKEERAILTEFAEGFGRGHTDDEAARCERYAEMLEKHTERLENSVRTEAKARLAVSLCASLMAVLFFA